MFLRFVRKTKLAGTSARKGFFTAAYELRDTPSVDPGTFKQLEELLAWFRENLAIPGRFSRSKSKGAYRRKHTAAMSWFKATANEHIVRSYELADLLERQGYPIEVLKSQRPGYIVYEDEFQVVAEPFADK